VFVKDGSVAGASAGPADRFGGPSSEAPRPFSPCVRRPRGASVQTRKAGPGPWAPGPA
jgi:hypothetical protein